MIYHVTTKEAWKKDEQSNSYCPGAFLTEGFIHACHLSQLEGVLQRYFTGHPDPLLLHIDESKLTSKVKEELSTGNELFPHIYGKINKDAIVRTEPLRH